MSAKQLQVDFPEVQEAIYGVALSLDAFLLNGIQYGVFQQAVFPGFVAMTASNLLRDLARLEEQARLVLDASQPKVTAILASLRTSCRQLIDLVTGLISFRTLPLQQLRSAVSQVLILREECVQRLQQLEACLQTPKPFYPSRPSHSTDSVNAFLAGLERAFVEEWGAANAGAKNKEARSFP